MKQFTKIFMVIVIAALSSVLAWGQNSETITYTFINKDWNATIENNESANWTNYTSGDSFETSGDARGIAKSKATINGTSPSVISNVTSITVVASANQAGPTLTIYKVVDNTETSIYSASMTKNNNKEYTVNLTGTNIFSGKIKVVLASSSSYKSVWIKSVAVTHSTGGSSPSITANNVNIAYDATVGSIAYTLDNATGNVSASVTEGNWLTLGTITSSAVPFTCSANTSTTARTAQVTLSFTGASDKVVTVTQAAAPTPSISADNVNIAYNATSGSIAFSINNGINGGAITSATVTSSTPSGWLTVNGSNPYSSPIGLSCAANDSKSSRTATVTLTYTYNTNQTVTKEVTITQAGNPNLVDSVSDITEAGEYEVKGTIVAMSNRGFILGDGTGYVYYYYGDGFANNNNYIIGDIVKLSGSVVAYGGVFEFNKSTTITAETSSNYVAENPTVLTGSQMDTRIGSTDASLSTYVQYQGKLSVSGTYYNITSIDGASTAKGSISYPTSTSFTSLDGKNVIVKGYYVGVSSSQYYNTMIGSIEEVVTPSISVNPTSATAFSYIFGNGPSEEQVFEIIGSHLTSAEITASVSSDYEITDNTDYSSSVTIGSGDAVSVRLKAGLAKGEHNGTLTLSTEGAQNVTVNLSGTVTGQTYEISQYRLPTTAHGTITFAPTSPVEDGTEVTLTAEPADGYEFAADSWVFYKEGDQDFVVDNTITVTDGKITMSAYALYVDATFAAKDTYVITTDAPHGTVTTDDEAWEGKSVTVLVEPATSFSFASIVVSKTGDSSTTIPVTGNLTNGFTFTMPAYAVTVTVTFVQMVTWDLSAASYVSNPEPTEELIQWTSSYATMKNERNGNNNTKVNNYIPTSQNSTRFYSGNKLTITPVSGYTITSVVFEATTTNYANALQGSTWTNASASVDDKTVTVTPTTGTSAFYTTLGGTCGFSEVKVYYEEYVEADAAPVWSELPSPETTVGTAIEEIDLSTYVTGHPTPTISVKTATADPLLYSLVNGIFNFTPNASGSATFVFTATNTVDEVEETADATLTITVNAAAAVNTPVLSVNDANVSSNSALVSWTACTGAPTYTIEHSASLLNESFEGNAVPNTWTKSSNVSVVSGKSGDGTYSIAFKAADAYLITPAINNPGTISFNYKRSSNDTAWSLDVSYASSPESTSWEKIGTVNDATTSWKTFSKTLSVSGTVYIRLIDTRSTGTHERYVDLIQVTGATTTAEVSGTSYTFKGLSAATTYAARVQVKDAETWSNMVTFTTEAATPATKDITIADGAKYNGRYWTTFYDGSNGYKLPAGAQAFKLDDNKLVLLGDSGVVIPKETAVVIVSDKTSLTLTETNAMVTVGANDLVGSATAVTVTDGKVDGKIPHVLSIKGSPAVIGFYKFTGSEIPAGKAYVLVSK